MTWSVSASGHHNTSDWVAEEHDLLRSLVEAFKANEKGERVGLGVRGESLVVSSFSFSGNHIQASSLADAEAKLAEFDKKGES